jgi:hypothetical protein
MTAALKLTLGEIAFAVATVDSYDRAAAIVLGQVEVDRIQDALLLIQISSHSLLARELATALTPRVVLTPAVQHIGEVFARSHWMLRCVKEPRDAAATPVLLHCSPAGVLAHEVVTQHVQAIAPLADVGALITRVDRLFELSHADHAIPDQQLPRTVFDALMAAPEARAIEGALLATARHAALAAPVRAMLAHDLAAPVWQGGVSWAHYPTGVPPETGPAFWLYSGERTWLCVAAGDTVVIADATRQRVANAVARALERVPAEERRFVAQRAGN